MNKNPYRERYQQSLALINSIDTESKFNKHPAKGELAIAMFNALYFYVNTRLIDRNEKNVTEIEFLNRMGDCFNWENEYTDIVLLGLLKNKAGWSVEQIYSDYLQFREYRDIFKRAIQSVIREYGAMK